MQLYFSDLQIGRTFRLLYPERGLGWLTKISKQVAITQNGERVKIKHGAVSTLPPYDVEKQA